MQNTQCQQQSSLNALRNTLAVSLLVLAQVASANEIGITPSQRLLNLDSGGLVTLRFEIENRSGNTQQLQEQIVLPPGWQLISNIAPFYLTSNARDVRLIHVNLPKNANAGTYDIGYNISAIDNGGIASQETITVRLAAQSGLKISQHQAPGSLLENEDFLVDFSIENTGNHPADYSLAAYDSDDFIQSVTPNRVKLEPGRSKIVRIKGKVNRKIDETRRYSLTLQANGGGNRSHQTASIPLIARTPKGIGKYQKLAGQLTGSYTADNNKSATHNENSHAFQLEYYASGSLDSAGEHNVAVKLRNGEKHNATGIVSQLEEYYTAYWNDDVKVKLGHQSFSTTRLTGNSLSGIGGSVSYKHRKEDGKTPLKLNGFYGETRPGESQQERSVFAELSYDWGAYEVGASILRYQKTGEPENTIMTASAGWQGENITLRSEIAKDNEGKAASIDFSGQWDKLGFNASATYADALFDGSVSDSIQLYSNLHYRLNKKTSFSFSARQTRNNLDKDLEKEIRKDHEQRISLTRTFGENDQIEITAGYRQRREKDERINATTDQTIRAATLQYRHRFAEFDVSASVEKGFREDFAGDKQSGTHFETVLNWHPTHKLNVGSSYAVNNGLDRDGKTTTLGANIQYKLNSRSTMGGFIQEKQNDHDDSHSRSYALSYRHDLKKYGQLALTARRTDNLSADHESGSDHSIRFEYSLPLDMPFRKRKNIGSVKGHLRYPDNTPAENVVLQMDGQYAVTDEKGEFNYPDVVAREYQINIDNTRANAEGLILDGAARNNRVEVLPDQQTDLVLALQKGARLEGTLQQFVADSSSTLFGDSDNQSLVPEKGISMVVFELKPIGEKGNRITYRRSTLFDGSFSFLGIPPGQWELSVADTSKLPDNYRLEQNRYAIDLSPGSSQNILVKALPLRRSIKKAGPSQGFSVSG